MDQQGGALGGRLINIPSCKGSPCGTSTSVPGDSNGTKEAVLVEITYKHGIFNRLSRLLSVCALGTLNANV